MSQPSSVLLQPSLSQAASAPFFSARATFFVAFFGGPFAACLIHALNARTMGRLRQDAFPLALAMIAAVAVLLVSILGVQGHLEWFPQVLTGRQGARFAIRFLGLAVWGAFYLLHRPLHRAAQLNDSPHRSPWIAGIGCVFAAAMLHLVIGVILQWSLAAQ